MLSGVTSSEGVWVVQLAPALWTATLTGGEQVAFETSPSMNTLRLELDADSR